jgi:hypothetical protein
VARRSLASQLFRLARSGRGRRGPRLREPEAHRPLSAEQARGTTPRAGRGVALAVEVRRGDAGLPLGGLDSAGRILSLRIPSLEGSAGAPGR